MVKYKHVAVIVLIAFAAGFLLDRATFGNGEKTRLVAGKTVKGAVYADFKLGRELKEFKTEIKDLPLMYWKVDTVLDEIYVKQKIDTAKIIGEFITKREYSFNVFNNEQGKLDIKQVVQYNRLQSFDYTFTPIHIEKTSYRRPILEPFASASYSTFGIAGIGGGLFYKNTGVEYNYLYSVPDNRTGHMVGVKVRF